jgi:hypothetical protein
MCWATFWAIFFRETLSSADFRFGANFFVLFVYLSQFSLVSHSIECCHRLKINISGAHRTKENVATVFRQR